MRLFARSFLSFSFFLLFSFLFTSIALAVTTPFRSANIIETKILSGTSAYVNLDNCSETDGLTCDKPLGTGTVDLYFRDFGTYEDFGMPSNAGITKIRIRATGKTNLITYAGLTVSNPFVWPFTTSNCQYPSDLWTLWDLLSNTIKSKLFITNVINTGTVTQAISGNCLSSSFFENKELRLKINGSSPSTQWSANIDNLEIAFDYDAPITPTPTPTPTPAPTPTPTPTPTPILKVPLILIPGIGGSELKTDEMKVWAEDNGHGGKFNYLYPKDETVWLNEGKATEFGEDDYFDVLRMKTDGINSEVNLGLTGNLVSRAYQGAIDFFTSNGYELNKDFFLFPYDWRKDISGTKDLLDEKIQEIKSQTGSQKVDILAHSMGGLVARSYISDLGKAKNVRKLFTLGTPHLGSVGSLKNLRYGGCLTKQGILSKLADFNVCFGLIPSETNDVVRNMISVFQLVPSRTYFDFYSGQDNQHPYPYKNDSDKLNYNQTKEMLQGYGHNSSLFNYSENFHSLDEKLPDTNGVDITLIAGSGQPTLGQIIEKSSWKDIGIINGDKTVPLFSASLIDEGNDKSLLGSEAKVFYTNQDHGGLVASGSALNLVKNILDDNSDLPVGISDKPYSLPLFWWLFSKHSPVDMNIYDSENNHTGPTADGFEANIPGSSYDTLGDEAFILIPDNGTYSVKFEATGNGSFDFRVRKFENENISQEILYDDVPLTISTKAELTFNTSSSENPIMHVDEDGNGTTDKEVNSHTSSNPTSIPSTAPTPSPTSTPFPTVPPISQRESIILEENNVLGAKTDFQKEREINKKTLAVTEKMKNLPPTISLVVLIGVITIFYFKFKK